MLTCRRTTSQQRTFCHLHMGQLVHFQRQTRSSASLERLHYPMPLNGDIWRSHTARSSYTHWEGIYMAHHLYSPVQRLRTPRTQADKGAEIRHEILVVLLVQSQ